MPQIKHFRRVESTVAGGKRIISLSDVADDLFSSSKRKIDPFAVKFRSLSLSNFDDIEELQTKNDSNTSHMLAMASLAVEVRTQLMSRMRQQLMTNTTAALTSMTSRKKRKSNSTTSISSTSSSVSKSKTACRLSLLSISPSAVLKFLLSEGDDVPPEMSHMDLSNLDVQPIPDAPLVSEKEALGQLLFRDDFFSNCDRQIKARHLHQLM
ncbi:hypothetical protein GEMRC1_002636 [Eukaryota sp. GEM-RC1]